MNPLHCKHKQGKIIALREENMKLLRPFSKIRFCCYFEILMQARFVLKKINNEIIDPNTKRCNDFVNAYKKAYPEI